MAHAMPELSEVGGLFQNASKLPGSQARIEASASAHCRTARLQACTTWERGKGCNAECLCEKPFERQSRRCGERARGIARRRATGCCTRLRLSRTHLVQALSHRRRKLAHHSHPSPKWASRSALKARLRVLKARLRVFPSLSEPLRTGRLGESSEHTFDRQHLRECRCRRGFLFAMVDAALKLCAPCSSYTSCYP